MIEPPQPGFTGVVWGAREPDRLARELATGPGAVPMAEAGAAWTRLAAGFGTAVAEYELIVAALRGAWQSSTSGPVLDRVSMLRDWLADAATAAGNNASRAETQAAAYELARLTMPHTAEIAAIQAVQRMLESIGGAIGAPLKAVAAQTDTDADLAKAAASRVMQTYEAATEPLATPWIQQEPPVIASPAALAVEEASATVSGPSMTMPALPGITPGMFMPGGLAAVATPAKLRPYRAPVVTEAPQPVEMATPQPVSTSSASASALPMVPGAMAPGATGQDEEYAPRAAAVTGDAIGADLGIAAAPAVLGAPEAPAAPTGQTASGGAT
ncbi:PPE domain-containing protein [Nocardia sp. NBC_00565]|uniref:PPE domain-containing protein n=1 Tax=Nocardia sp. NBC_00565 TaxID=2975993 RepID=UPI002E80F353|nr:PPE domain-containing protein [Nocardia sp. NBC_00565]WUC02877.1 PPE domain-containing protein [Nocardia sp. NBC_00565]